MALDTIPGRWTVGYLGPDDGVAADALADMSGTERRQLTRATLPESDIDALVVDTAAVADGAERLLTAIEAADPPVVIAVGADDAVPASAIGVVDEYVSVADSTAELHALIDDYRERHWTNLGMSAEQLLETIFDEVPIHLYLKDSEARHTRASHPYEKEFDLIGQTDVEAYPNERLATQAYEDDKQVIGAGDPVLDKEEYDETDGTWTVCSKVPVRDDEGQIVGLLGVTKHITARKEAQRDLERQIERLEDFASILSHDLRNPLSITLGRAELAHELHPDDEHVESILRNVKRMGAIIEDVLTMTKQGQQVEATERVSLEEIAEQSWENVPTGDASLTVTGDIEFQAASGRLKHVFENLFDNAVTHGPSDERSEDDLSVTVEPLPGRDGFAVADDGQGIPADERDGVFEQGYSTADGGTGFGLNIVQQAVQAHDWEITVTEGADDGARFEITGVESDPPSADDGDSVE